MVLLLFNTINSSPKKKPRKSDIPIVSNGIQKIVQFHGSERHSSRDNITVPFLIFMGSQVEYTSLSLLYSPKVFLHTSTTKTS